MPDTPMDVDITGRHVDITPVLRQLIDRRLARLGRLLNDSVVSAQVILTREKYRHLTELIVRARGDRTLRGLGEGTTWPLSVRDAADKIEQQGHTLKGKRDGRKRQFAGSQAGRRTDAGSSSVRSAPGPRASRAAADGPMPARAPVVRAARYAVKPMTIDEAATRLEATDEAFVVFRGVPADAIRILYRRKDGKLGLIEPD